ncbi:uncharacterized protein LOC129725647 isoform X2 [Wyeomyia smithii]|uniref:uncharacterized protein LOC129725647 isoform X2 n=1 Tax=Wyeomyia smithii TaxID=174621 RepID=UPI002468154D|nr:uncharacterized protein LOC129725647 isoform X2 [Wyeomyia smithii]
MDLFASLIANKCSAPKTLKVRKVYEKSESCPKCWSQNRQSSVRYMYINMQEAIYKCEAAGCMYPFRDFKYKNYVEQTVYYYQAADEEISIPDFSSLAVNEATTPKDVDQAKTSQTGDFKLTFESPERFSSQNAFTPFTSTPGQSDLNIFDSPSLSYKNLAEGFDTGFIDDILNDLGEPSPEKKQINTLPLEPVTHLEVNKTKRQLKRCLQMFQEDKAGIAKPDNELFKVPPLPGSENANSHKVKVKKVSPSKRHKSNRRTNYSTFPTAERLLKKNRMQPLQFLETLNSIRTNSEGSQQMDNQSSTQLPANKKLGNNQKVARMLDFIERSMKNRAPIVEPVIINSTDLVLKRVKRKSRKKKELKRRSLSQAVLQDSQFEYSSSEEDHSSSSAVSSDNDSTQCSDEEPFLPSFRELVHSIHPCQSTAGTGAGGKMITASSTTGFRSAGCSPTRIDPWEATPPRRIQSMESLSSLLE